MKINYKICFLFFLVFASTEYKDVWAGNCIGNAKRVLRGKDLLEAAGKGDLNNVRRIIDRGLAVDYVSDSGETALLKASYNGHSEVVYLLLDRGANVHRVNNYNVTALMWASYNGHLQVVRLLLDRGANIDQSGTAGGTPLIWASKNGHLQVVLLLLEKRASINHANNFEETALMEASDRGHQAIVNLLQAELDEPGRAERLSREARQAVVYANLCAVPGLKGISAEVLKLVSQCAE